MLPCGFIFTNNCVNTDIDINIDIDIDIDIDHEFNN